MSQTPKGRTIRYNPPKIEKRGGPRATQGVPRSKPKQLKGTKLHWEKK